MIILVNTVKANDKQMQSKIKNVGIMMLCYFAIYCFLIFFYNLLFTFKVFSRALYLGFVFVNIQGFHSFQMFC